jgi:hypothetical protein
MINRKKLKQLISYDPHSGYMRWRTIPSPRVKIGDPVGCIDFYGRRIVMIDGHQYSVARMAWLYMTGKMPGRVAFKKGDGSQWRDFRWSNLRSVV